MLRYCYQSHGGKEEQQTGGKNSRWGLVKRGPAQITPSELDFGRRKSGVERNVREKEQNAYARQNQ